MYVKSEIADSLQQKSQKLLEDQGVYDFLPFEKIGEFADLVEQIGMGYEYKEGERILPSHLTTINQKVGEILDHFGNILVERNIAGHMTQGQVLSAMMGATDYLFAVTQSWLGSPDMEPSFGSEIQNKITDFVKSANFDLKNKNFEKVSGDFHYKNQRKMNADRVAEANRQLAFTIGVGKATPLEIATYAAEYKALKQRQENHGRVWRFFHKSENKARTDLLASMKETLAEAVGKDVDVDALDPQAIAEAYHGGKAGKMAEDNFLYNSIAKRYGIDSKNVFEKATDDTRALEDEARIAKNKEQEEIRNELRDALKQEFEEKTSEADESILYYVDDDEIAFEKTENEKSLS